MNWFILLLVLIIFFGVVTTIRRPHRGAKLFFGALIVAILVIMIFSVFAYICNRINPFVFIALLFLVIAIGVFCSMRYL